ncbi:Crp/Fnr family transcriptional regulator [Noviherbaspirillum saxi]|nr:Crp/Fnr family transcriptional regulator [Noviherbaspirillum saxi]
MYLEQTRRFQSTMLERFGFSEKAYWDAAYVLAELAQPVSFRKGEYLQRQGEPAKAYYWITRGIARTGYLAENGAEVTLRFAAESEIAGTHDDLLDAETGTPARCFVVAEECIECFKFDWFVSRRLEAEGVLPSEMSARIIEYNLRKQARSGYINGVASAQQRLAAFRNDYPGLEARVTRKVIASYLGITPQYLSQLSKSSSGSYGGNDDTAA